MSTSKVAQYLRDNKRELIADWERAVCADLKELARIERGALIDHLPEVLDGLAAWIEGRTAEADRHFAALADGHAIQRLGYDIELAVVIIEYGWVRHVVLRHLLSVEMSSEGRAHLVRLNEGLDRAVHLSVRRYTERRDSVRNRFIGILGHDLRNPLAAVRAATDSFLRSETLTENDRRRMLVIARAADRMNRMISDVLDFARGHLGGGIPANPAPCDVGEICHSAADEVRIARPDRSLAVKLQGDLRGVFDRDRMLQALGNLIMNAVHHGEDPIVVAATETTDRRAIVTQVTNRGRAIPREMLTKLFEPFAHAGDRTRGSLGLGLYIVAQIAAAHGATYEVSSDASETSFTIRWPRTPLAETPDRA